MGSRASDERKLHNGATVAGYRRKLNLAYCGNRRYVKPKVSSEKRTERRQRREVGSWEDHGEETGWKGGIQSELVAGANWKGNGSQEALERRFRDDQRLPTFQRTRANQTKRKRRRARQRLGPGIHLDLAERIHRIERAWLNGKLI